MKAKMLIIVLLFSLNFTFAQSDYEKVQNFKRSAKQISNSIDQVESDEALDSLYLAIISLRDKYESDKELLDESLYPDDFSTTIRELETKLKSRREGMADVGMLKAQIASLKNQVDNLNQENTNLLNRIKEFREVAGTGSGSVNELRRMVSDLKEKLKQRDELVRSLVDSLLSDFVRHPMSLNEAEKQEMYEKVETGNLFFNVEKTVRDNLEYLKVSKFGPEELSELKENQVQFYNTWKKIGPKLSDLYKEQGDQTGDVAYITNLFSEWEQKLDDRIWDKMSQTFRDNSVNVDSFNSGEEFVNSLLNYISDQKESTSEIEFKQFRDSVWIAELKTEWLPGLIDNEMISADQKESLESAIGEWQAVYDTDTPYYWYVLIGFILLVFLLIFVPKWKDKNKPLSQQ